MVKKYILLSFLLFIVNGLIAQDRSTLSLEEAYSLLEANYPLLQNGALYEEGYENQLAQLDKSRLPAIYLRADGRVQSEGAGLELDPGVMLPFEINLPPYSAKAYLEAQYLILDGGLTDAQRNIAAAQLKVDQQKLETDKFSLRERVNNLFLGVQLIRAQMPLLDLSLDDLESRMEMVSAAVEYGTMLESELNRLQVKKLELLAQRENMIYQSEALVKTLGALVGVGLSPNVELVFPMLGAPNAIPSLQRPETALFQFQREAILAQESLIQAGRKPKLSAYAQAGTGYPNPVNFLDANFAPYAILGVQFSWQITDWKSSKLQKEKLSLKALEVQNAEETFRFNLESQTDAYLVEIQRLDKQIELGEEVAALQTEILAQLAAQLEEGVIPVSEYVSQVNTELKARQNLLINQTEKTKVQLEFWNQRAAF